MSNATRSYLAAPLHFAALVAAFFLVVLSAPARAQQNNVLGEVRFDGTWKIDKTSGVWIDGQYLGFVSELKGDNDGAVQRAGSRTTTLSPRPDSDGPSPSVASPSSGLQLSALRDGTAPSRSPLWCLCFPSRK